jgi:hypothetical protein
MATRFKASSPLAWSALWKEGAERRDNVAPAS